MLYTVMLSYADLADIVGYNVVIDMLLNSCIMS